MNIGIDLGTSNTVVSWMNIFGSIEFLKFDDGSVLLPSCIYSQKGKIIAGSEAAAMSEKNPKNFISCSKVYMDDRQKIWTLDGLRFRPDDVAFEILKKVKKALMTRFPDEKEFNAVLTVPAKFSEDAVRRTADALKRSGIGLKEIIKEPVAAVLAYYDESFDVGDIVYVIDFGGGTTDTALVKITSPDKLSVIAAAGDRHLGGKDLDDIIYRMVMTQLRSCCGQDLLDETTTWGVSRRSICSRVRQMSGEIKKELYKSCISQPDKPVERTDEKICSICEHTDTCSLGGQFSFSISYDEYETQAREIFDRLVRLITDDLSVFAESSVSIEDVDHVLFAGGMCTDIYLQQFVRRVFDNSDIIFASDEEDDEKYLTVIARGAGIKACDDRIHIVNKLVNSIGVLCRRDNNEMYIDPVIKSCADIDESFVSRHTYTNSSRFETEMAFEIYEYSGDPDDLRDTEYRKLGVLVFNDIIPADKGCQRIEAEFTFDSDGLMCISAYDRINGRNIRAALKI
ncbi:MAG: Hsp70 family protein [Oscillospiraceae bacterium]|nr:Hsp70 family protein [Oscillospiraceae bacterium]